MQLAAVLWDMDGLLVDSEPLWTVAEVALAEELGGTWSDQLKAAIAGTRLDIAVPAILEHYGCDTDPATVTWASQWLLARMVTLYQEDPPLLPGVPELLGAIHDAGIPQALVSSSFRVLVDAVLAHGYGPFALSLCGDEVGHGKPHPEPYLTAAARLGVDPAACVVLEDSAAGVLSGEAAGCAVVAVPSVPGVSVLQTARTWVRRSLAEVDLLQLQQLVAAR
ncbi:MAG: HAD-superfamily hydrolase, subfamily variant 3 [Frankiales bacterium]|nr:HAD-superfamily hydrolase, subfamily variant 3 [Frankiales bacterium]